MMKRFQGLIGGVLIGAILMSGMVFAKQASETINVIYDNIKIMIDGKEYLPTDANGDAVEPFIYNGTTYLPVRAIANAFDKDVEWEAQTSTVTLGSKNYDWLDQMGYADYEYSAVGNSFSTIPSGTKASDGIKYDRGLQFKLNDYKSGSHAGTIELNDGTLQCFESISYLTNYNYSSFEGTICALDEYAEANSIIKIYGDGKLLYTSPVISSGTKSTKFNIDISDVKLIKINVEVLNITGYTDYSYPCIADARLLKK